MIPQNDNEAIALIKENYPDLLIYMDDYKSMFERHGTLFLDLKQYTRSAGYHSIKEWLIARKMYRLVERDMRISDLPSIVLSDSEIDIARKVFASRPLIGDISLFPAQQERLFLSAQKTFDKIQSDTPFTKDEAEVLVFVMILLLQKNKATEDNEEMSFWPYLYSQFGYPYASSSQTVYKKLQNIINTTFENEGRYLAPYKTTQRYYSSLMLHALAPQESMESLFEILLYFYTDELEYSYLPKDPAYAAIVNCIAYRWDKSIETNEDLHVRSNVLASGLRILFRERPAFMAYFCEDLVRKIDALVRCQGDTLINQQSRLDQMLEEWFTRKTAEQKEKLYKSHTSRKVVRHADSVNHIRIQYILDREELDLYIPPIRLETIAESEPVFVLIQGGEQKTSGLLDVYGRLTWTVREQKLRLSDLDIDLNDLSDLEFEIHYNGECLLNTGSSLHRQFLVFDKEGREIPRQSIGTGKYYLFAAPDAIIRCSEGSTVYPVPNSSQLTELLLAKAASVTINGAELIQSSNNKSNFRRYSSVDYIQDACVLSGNEKVSIYPEPVTFSFILPDGSSPLRYHIMIDEEELPLLNYCDENSDHFDLSINDRDGKIHRISMIDMRFSQMVFEYQYIVLDHFSFLLDQNLYYDEPNTVIQGCLQYGTAVSPFETVPEDSSDICHVQIESLPFDIEIRVPLVSCHMSDINLLTDGLQFWYTDIKKDDFVTISMPSGWEPTLLLEGQAVPFSGKEEKKWELGNFVSTFHCETSPARLGLILRKKGEAHQTRFLADIFYQAETKRTLLQLDDNNGLYWNPQGNIICGPRTAFKLVIHVSDNPEDNYTYNLTLKPERLCRRFPYDLGIFPYEITMIDGSSIFNKVQKIIWSGELRFGNSHELRLMNHAIRLTRCTCMVFTKNNFTPDIVEIGENAAWLSDFMYLGELEFEGEGTFPAFQAMIYFYDINAQTMRPFNSNERSAMYELINPVTIYLVNDHVLGLTTVTGDPIQIDKRYNSVVNRKLLYLSSKEEMDRIRIPDSFEYELMEVPYV